jgi:hypothetical protein
MRNWVIVLAVLASVPAFGDTRFRVRQMTRNDVPFGRGQCDIRLQVDNEVEVAVRRDMVVVRTISGQDARDDGSECNFPLPDRDVRNFGFQVTDSRNDIRLMEPPTRRNDFAAIVRIRDGAGGFGRYVFRLTWEIAPEGDRRGDSGRPDFDRDGPARGGPGFAWNNVINFRGRGSGQSSVNNFGPERLMDCSVDIDRGGHITVSFRTERGRSMVFNGSVIGKEGARIKGDMATEDHRLRGPMFLSVDDRQMVNSITLDATDGRDRLHLVWDRR